MSLESRRYHPWGMKPPQGKHMAQSRFIEKREGDTWKSVSSLFSSWLKDHGFTENFGWVEGDSLNVSEELEFYCMCIPEKHGKKIHLFEQWADSTDRIYGLAEGRHVKFPKKPELDLTLPPEPTVVVPPWLK